MNLQTRTMSHGAAEYLVRSGSHTTQCDDIFRILDFFPNSTALQLAQSLKRWEKYWQWDLHRVVTMVRRRLHDLELKGLATPEPQAKGPQRWTAKENVEHDN